MQYKVIIDTDIGDDIDDIFALTYCLCNPSFDIKLIIVSWYELRQAASLSLTFHYQEQYKCT